MKTIELMLQTHVSYMLIILALDYNLPFEITIGDTVVIGYSNHCRNCIYKRILVTVDEEYDEVLEAALSIVQFCEK